MPNLPCMNEDNTEHDAIETNDKGGKQSHCPARFDLLPPLALDAVAQRFDYGVRRYDNNHCPSTYDANWRLVDIEAHVNHMLAHVLAFNARDTTDKVNKEVPPHYNHLAAAVWRGMVALELLWESHYSMPLDKPVAYKNSASGEMAPVPKVPYDGRIPGQRRTTYITIMGVPMNHEQAIDCIDKGYKAKRDPMDAAQVVLVPPHWTYSTNHLEDVTI